MTLIKPRWKPDKEFHSSALLPLLFAWGADGQVCLGYNGRRSLFLCDGSNADTSLFLDSTQVA